MRRNVVLWEGMTLSPRQNGDQWNLRWLRGLCLTAFLLYLSFGVLFRWVVDAPDAVSLEHRVVFGLSFLALWAGSLVSAWVQKQMVPLTYAVGAAAMVHMLVASGHGGADTGVLLSMILGVPVLIVLFYRWKLLLYANLLLFVITVMAVAASAQTTQDALLFTASAVVLNGFALLFAKRMFDAEQDSRHHEALFGDLFEHTTDAIFIQEFLAEDAGESHHCQIIKVNSTFAELAGSPSGALVGRALQELWPAMEGSMLCGQFRRAVERQKAVTFDEYLPDFVGHYRVTIIPIGPQRGAVVLADITAQMAMEQAEREREARFRGVFEGSPDGIFIVDERGVIVDCNEQAAVMNGYSKDELLGQPIAVVNASEETVDISYDPQGKSFPPREYFEYLRREGKLQFRSIHRRKDGTQFPVEVSATLVNLNGQEYSVGFDRDISDRDVLMAQLRENEQKLQLMARNLKDVIFELDSDGRYTYVSPAHEAVLGRGEEVIGTYHTDSLAYEDKHHALAALRRAAVDKREVRVEYRYINPERGLIWLESVASSYVNRDGEVAVVVTARDISQRKRAEEALYQQAQRQELAAKLASEFLNESLNQVDERISESLEHIGKTLGGDRCHISQLANGGRTVTTTHEWLNIEVDYPFARTSDLDLYDLPWLYGQIIARSVVALSSLDDLPPDAWAERRRLKERGVKSLICVPMMTGGEVTGLLSVYFLQNPRFATDDDVHMLQIAAGVMASALERAKAERQLTHLTFHDQVTGLYNRTFLEEEIRRLDTERQLPLSMIMIDVNGLKMVNDALGHQEGDRLLRRVAQLLRQSCRQEDIVARWGGDEFVVLLPSTDSVDAGHVCQRIRAACDAADERPVRPSVALGYSTKTSAEQEFTQVLKEAEDGMYTNKMSAAQSSRSTIIASLQRTLEEKSHETREHAQKLRDLSIRLGERVGISGTHLEELALFAVLHDLGKVAIPETVLDKRGSLTEDEWEVMRKHPEIGYRIAATSPELASVAEYILSHHEHWDGSGYPRGLKGEEIPLLARIVAVVDAYDAMTSDRPYRKGTSHGQALEEIRSCAGEQFDPRVVDAFLDMFDQQPAEKRAADA